MIATGMDAQTKQLRGDEREDAIVACVRQWRIDHDEGPTLDELCAELERQEKKIPRSTIAWLIQGMAAQRPPRLILCRGTHRSLDIATDVVQSTHRPTG